VTQKEEILARTLSAAVALDAVPDESWLVEFVTSLRRRDECDQKSVA
jgi:hypothetical protein